MSFPNLISGKILLQEKLFKIKSSGRDKKHDLLFQNGEYFRAIKQQGLSKIKLKLLIDIYDHK